MPFAIDDSTLVAKERSLIAALGRHRSLLVAFSGGVDSAYLAVAARVALGADRVLAVLGVSAAVPLDVRERAPRIAAQFEIPFREVATHELDDTGYAANQGNRCFYCKRELWTQLSQLARDAGFAAVADGTIIEDLAEHRPGRAAGAAAGIVSPLAACGFNKTDVRAAARARGIPIWDAPASPCLASRMAVGVAVTHERLAMVERAESALRALGIAGDLRVRHIGDAARVELAPDALCAWQTPDGRGRIIEAVRRAGFAEVSIDPRGYRRGSVSVAVAT